MFFNSAFTGRLAAARPRITGIDHVAFYTTSPDGVKKLYGDVLGLASAEPVEPGGTLRYIVGKQWVGYSPAPDPKSTDRMDHVALTTDNIAAMRKYLTGQGIKVPQIQGRGDHSLFFVLDDPDGHKIEFVERGKSDAVSAPESAVSRHMIHAGFLVYHREAADHFYRDILGFRPYWHGGMKDDVTEWFALQVPDGTDWIEYMLNQPEHASSAADWSDEPYLSGRSRDQEGAGDFGITRLEAARRRKGTTGQRREMAAQFV